MGDQMITVGYEVWLVPTNTGKVNLTRTQLRKCRHMRLGPGLQSTGDYMFYRRTSARDIGLART